LLHKNTIAILGIHTGIGKTIASAVITEALNADYWKPVQAGLEERDTALLEQLLTGGPQRVHEEALKLKLPMSPHAAAAAEGVTIDYTKFKWPETDKTLIVETAGGILSPMSSETTMADFVSHYQLPAILVVQNYLGSINHTLMSLEVLKSRNIKLLGIVINGEANESSESFIIKYSKVPVLTRIPLFAKLDNDAVAAHAAIIKNDLINELRSSGFHF
jgi:dethiobiotin synthetase